ncbi:MAG TPA: glycosyltransferase family 4 protein [Kaistia sp.]|nr:glycosyltransferase family 4 protein [Kaistia sp.]
MRIAQVAPLLEAVPPRLYGGTERVVSWLTEALVAEGHDVTLFATGDSQTRARHFVTRAEASRGAGRDHAALADVFAHVRSQIDDFDIVHFHTEFAHFGAFPGAENKCLTTLHLRLDSDEAAAAVAAHPEMPLVSISDNQRLPLPGARFVATVPHGMPEDMITEGDGSGGYLLFLGRISPDKRPDRAIAVASALGLPLKIAAKVDAVDERYFREEIEPLLATEGVDYLGERDDSGKAELLGKAQALLFPIDWPEPFGLVMIEAMAAGTPVVAWRAGSVPEVIEPGVTGRIVESLDEAVEAVRSIGALSRPRIRKEFERRFTAHRMAQDYVNVYRMLLGG